MHRQYVLCLEDISYDVDDKAGFDHYCTYFFAVHCKKDPLAPLPSKNSLFSLELPPDYVHVTEQGIDSYVGYYTGSRGSIGYDCGMASFSMGDIKPADHIYYEEAIVEGTLAKIVIEERTDGKRLSMYITKGTELTNLRLYTYNPPENDIEFFIKVFKSLKFK